MSNPNDPIRTETIHTHTVAGGSPTIVTASGVETGSNLGTTGTTGMTGSTGMGTTGTTGMSAHDNSGMLTGLFRDRESAERAYQSLSERGYDKKDVNLVMSDETRTKHFSGTQQTELGSKAAEGAGIGGAIGGTLGAIAAAVAAVGTALVVPGLGLVVAGPLAAAVAGAGAGGVTGGLLGALIGWGIPEERVKHYEAGIKEGGILMGVKPRSDDDARYLQDQWKSNRGEHVYL